MADTDEDTDDPNSNMLFEEEAGVEWPIPRLFLDYGSDYRTLVVIALTARTANAHDFITELADGYDTEVLIQRSLDDLITDRTTFAIAHRLSTVRHADTIIVLENGEILEQGIHEELLHDDGLYANLWRVQVGEYEALPDEFLEQTARSADTNVR